MLKKVYDDAIAQFTNYNISVQTPKEAVERQLQRRIKFSNSQVN
ncbi:hypothetical protein [Nostoc sp. CALU 1950]